MASNRRGFLQALMGVPGVAAFLPRGSSQAEAAPSERRDVYRELGVRPLINAAGTYTYLSGSLIRPEAVAAMEAAARQFVNLQELQEAVGRKIAALLSCEAAMVTAGAASALTLGTAACVAGKDADKIRRLPDIIGFKYKVVIQKAHRYGYEHALRNVGIQFVEVETVAELERAVTNRTALMLFFNDAEPLGQIKAAEFAKLGKKLGVPTFIDAAADVPPVENFTRFLKMGFDLVTFSGGKAIRGPQSAGLLLGRKDLIEAAALNNNPHTDSVGRTNKVGKEELVGMWAALEAFVKQDHAAVWKMWEERVKVIARLVSEVKGVKTETFVPPIANHSPHLRIVWDFAGSSISPADVVKRLHDNVPRIEVRPGVKDAIEVAVWMLEPGEDAIVGRRLRAVLTGNP